MKSYKASLIISIYDNTTFLRAVLDSLALQTETDFEVIISEDGCRPAVADFVRRYPFQNDVQHLVQEDIGWRKEMALNKAIRAARADRLVFIDGDCVLHPRFMEWHIRWAEEGTVLAGNRIKLPPRLSRRLLSDTKGFLPRLPLAILRTALTRSEHLRHAEEGFYFSPAGFPGCLLRHRRISLIGSNMSFSKSAIETINGFDENYVKPAIGEDADLNWRFRQAGFRFRSLRNFAVQYHLHHPEIWHDQSENTAYFEAKKARGEYVCKNGLEKRT